MYLGHEPDILVPFANLLVELRNNFFSLLEIRADLRNEAGFVQKSILQTLSHGDPGREALFRVQSYQSYVKAKHEGSSTSR